MSADHRFWVRRPRLVPGRWPRVPPTTVPHRVPVCRCAQPRGPPGGVCATCGGGVLDAGEHGVPA